MQGNLARVIFQFKQYAQNITYLMGRALQQSLAGESPEVRRVARRQFAATLGAVFTMSGALGLPGLSALGGIIGLVAGQLGDDDDTPWDWKVEFRNLAADTFGVELGEVLSKGVPRALMPWDIAGRVGMNDLWFRSNGREGQNPREAFAADAVSLLGPTASTVLGMYTAADQMARGNYTKAAEAVIPKAARDVVRAVREGTSSVTTYAGEPVTDVSAGETVGRILGFAPARVGELMEGRSAVMNVKTALEERRSVLLSRLVRAQLDGDGDTVVEMTQEIADFNRRHPEFKLTRESMRKSLENKRRNREIADDGIVLPPGKASLRERARFANTE
jgi:hypothetical protein